MAMIVNVTTLTRYIYLNLAKKTTKPGNMLIQGKAVGEFSIAQLLMQLLQTNILKALDTKVYLKDVKLYIKHIELLYTEPYVVL